MLCGKNTSLFVSSFWKACLQGGYTQDIARRNFVVQRQWELKGIWWSFGPTSWYTKRKTKFQREGRRKGEFLCWMSSMFLALCKLTFNWDARVVLDNPFPLSPSDSLQMLPCKEWTYLSLPISLPCILVDKLAFPSTESVEVITHSLLQVSRSDSHVPKFFVKRSQISVDWEVKHKKVSK